MTDLARRVFLLSLALAVIAGAFAPAAGARRIEGKSRFRERGSIEVSEQGGLGRIAVHGKVGAVLAREEGIVTLLDLANPQKPKALGTYDGGLEGGRAGSSLDGDLAFSDDGKWLFYGRQSTQMSADGLHVLDVSDPEAPSLAFFQPEGGTFRIGYYETADAAYVVTLDAIHGLVVNRFDATTGAAVPVFVDPLPALKVGGPASAGVWIDRKDPGLEIPLLYVSTGETGLQVYDLSTPEAPEILGAWDETGLAEIEVVATKNSRTVYAATEYWFDATLKPEIVELDASDLSNISERRRLGFGFNASDGFRIQGMTRFRGELFVAHSLAGLRSIKGSRPEPDSFSGGGKPNQMTALIGGPYAMDVVAARGHLFLTDAATGRLTAIKVRR